MVEAVYKDSQGQRLPSREIYRKWGGDYFRELEKQALEKLSQIDRHILSTGGGTFIYNPIPTSLKSHSKIVYLQVETRVLYQRIIFRGIPAFFQPDRPYESFQTLLKERVPVYEKLADLIIDNSSRGIEQAVRRILQWLETVLVDSLP